MPTNFNIRAFRASVGSAGRVSLHERNMRKMLLVAVDYDSRPSSSPSASPSPSTCSSSSTLSPSPAALAWLAADYEDTGTAAGTEANDGGDVANRGVGAGAGGIRKNIGNRTTPMVLPSPKKVEQQKQLLLPLPLPSSSCAYPDGSCSSNAVYSAGGTDTTGYINNRTANTVMGREGGGGGGGGGIGEGAMGFLEGVPCGSRTGVLDLGGGDGGVARVEGTAGARRMLKELLGLDTSGDIDDDGEDGKTVLGAGRRIAMGLEVPSNVGGVIEPRDVYVDADVDVDETGTNVVESNESFDRGAEDRESRSGGGQLAEGKEKEEGEGAMEGPRRLLKEMLGLTL